MIYVFDSIKPIKKEAKIIKKLCNQCIKLNAPSLRQCQDLAATFYGWSGYQQAETYYNKVVRGSHPHDMHLLRGKEFLRYKCLRPSIKPDYRLISALTKIEQKILISHKKACLTSFLNLFTVTPYTKSKITDSLFTSKSIITLLTEQLQSRKNSSKIEFQEGQGDHSVIIGDNKQQKARLISEHFLPTCVHRGGILVIDEDTLDLMFNDLVTTQDITKQPCYILNFSSNPWLETTLQSMATTYDISTQTSLHEVTTTVAHFLSQNTSIIHQEALLWWSCIMNFVCAENEPNESNVTLTSLFWPSHSELRNREDHNVFLNTLDTMINNSKLSSSHSTREALTRKINDMRRLEEANVATIKFDHIYELIIDAITSLRTKEHTLGGGFRDQLQMNSDFSWERAIENNAIVIVGLPNQHSKCVSKAANAALKTMQSSVARPLSYELVKPTEQLSSQNLMKEHFPIFYDCFLEYTHNNVAVLMSQYRALNIKAWFGVRDTQVLDPAQQVVMNNVQLSAKHYLFLNIGDYERNSDPIFEHILKRRYNVTSVEADTLKNVTNIEWPNTFATDVIDIYKDNRVAMMTMQVKPSTRMVQSL